KVARQTLHSDAEVLSLDVADIELHLPMEVDVAAPRDLPETGDSRYCGEPPPIGRIVEGDLRGNRRARPDQRHLAAKDINELWQLVQRKLAADTPDPGDAWVLPNLE